MLWNRAVLYEFRVSIAYISTVIGTAAAGFTSIGRKEEVIGTTLRCIVDVSTAVWPAIWISDVEGPNFVASFSTNPQFLNH
jgi:hypothetical protein